MKKTSIGFTIAALVIYLITLSACKNPNVLMGSTGEKKHMKIEGIVRARNGEPVKGISVLPLPHGGYPVETDEQGRFELEGPSEDRVICALLARDTENNLASLVETDDFNEPVDIILKPAVTLVGDVTDPNGKGIPGAEVSPSVRFKTYRAFFGYTKFEPADCNGFYEIKALPVGYQYTVFAHAEGYGRFYQYLDILSEPGCKNVQKIVLEPAVFSIKGVVLDENDKPMYGAFVQASGQGQPTIKTTKTDFEGKFTISGVCKGRVELLSSTSDHLWLGSDEANGGDTNVEIFTRKRKETCLIPTDKPIAPLLGRKLPDLSELNVFVSKDVIEGKRILVCLLKFSDGRDTIRQLAAESERLKAKGVYIVGGLIWPMNENQLNRWMKKNNITFPIGILPDPWQQNPGSRTFERWGLKSIPWLILTDKNHIVQAVGFSLEELDDKIKSINESLGKDEKK